MITALLGRLSAVHANHKRIASGILLVGLLTIGAKLFAVVREMAIAWRYGISGTVDAYQLALTVTTWLPTMLVGVATMVLVPRLVTLRRHPEEYREFVAELNGSFLILGVAIAALTWAVAPLASSLLAGPLGPDAVAVTAGMSAQLAPVAAIFIVAGYLVARLQARERFGFAAAEALPPIVLAAAVLAAPAGAGPVPLVWGTALGFLLYLVVLLCMAGTSDQPLGAMRFRQRSAQWQTLYRGLLLMTLAQLLIAATVPADQAFASRLGEGAVATLGYANRMISLITGLGTVVLARALLPVLSAAVAEGEIGFARRQAMQWSALMFLLALVGALIGWFLTPAGVTLLFKRGAFDAAAVEAVSTALRFGLIQLPPVFAGIALVQIYAATGRFRALLVVTAVALIVKLGLNAVLTPAFGLAGIMVATALMYTVTATMMVVGLGTWRLPFRSAA